MNPNCTLELTHVGEQTRLDRVVDSDALNHGDDGPGRSRGRRFKNAWGRRRRPSAAAPREHGEHRLTAGQERALATRIKAGDVDAGQQLITANLGLVLRAVDDYKQCGVPLDDLIQEGNLGLIRAARQFDPSTHTARFATYATYWIRCFMVRALASNGSLIQRPRRMRLLRLQYRRAVDDLRARQADASGEPGSKSPGLEEIADSAGGPALGPEPARLTQSGPGICQSIDKLLVASGPAPDQDVVINEDRALVTTALRQLSPFEAWVICERFGLGKPPGRGDQALARCEPVRENDGHGTQAGPEDAPPDQETRPHAAYFQRSYIDMGLDCGLSVLRIRQVEMTAFQKLRDFLGHRITDGT